MFKEGDLVRCVDGGLNSFCQGVFYVVKETRWNHFGHVSIKHDSRGSGTNGWPPSKFELFDGTYKVGDRVMVDGVVRELSHTFSSALGGDTGWYYKTSTTLSYVDDPQSGAQLRNHIHPATPDAAGKSVAWTASVKSTTEPKEGTEMIEAQKLDRANEVLKWVYQNREKLEATWGRKITWYEAGGHDKVVSLFGGGVVGDSAPAELRLKQATFEEFFVGDSWRVGIDTNRIVQIGCRAFPLVELQTDLGRALGSMGLRSGSPWEPRCNGLRHEAASSTLLYADAQKVYDAIKDLN